MAQAAAAAGGGGNNNNSRNDVSSVYRGVAAGETAARVRQLIEEYVSAGGARITRSCEARRSAAVNYMSSETPLEAADRLRRGDLVGVLLENGADPTVFDIACSALALAIHYGQIETLRALLRSGRHQANERLAYGLRSALYGESRSSSACSPAHLAVSLARLPRLTALEVLVREFGADVNARDNNDGTPLHWAIWVAPGHRRQMVDALVGLSGDLQARDNDGQTPIFEAVNRDPPMVLHLLSLGASADVLSTDGTSPLMMACTAGEPAARVTVPALLRASSPETRRAVSRSGSSAIDRLVAHHYCTENWCQNVIGELLSSGAPFFRYNAARVLPIAARHTTRLERRVAAAEYEPPPWPVHEAMVELAFDFQDVRAAEEGVTVRERRVRELEDELRALGVGTEDTDESEDEGGGESGGGEGGGGSS